MIRTNLSLLALLLALAAGLAPALADPSTARDDELIILNWEDYLSSAVIRACESETGARVRQIYFETDDARDQAMAEADGAGFDLLLLDRTGLTVYRKRGWLSPLGPAAVPNRRHLDPRWATAYPGSAAARGPGFAAVGADPNPVSTSLRQGEEQEPGDGGVLLVYRRITLPDNFLTRADESLHVRGYLALRVSLAGFEALLRWHSEALGWVPRPGTSSRWRRRPG